MPRQVYRVCVALPVSIRARHCWRAMHAAICCAVGIRHVSIRARHCWRAMPGHAITSSSLAIVSIRARHCWRAMRRANRLSWVASLFQSAPAIAGGRCPVGAPLDDVAGRFQSAPAIAGGRCRCRPRWRRPRRCFNPRPPLLAGDAVTCWSAQPGRSFQSAPAIAGGRCRQQWVATPPLLPFQSAPAIAGGRCRTSCRSCQRYGCFNPRPPLLAGDAALYGKSRLFGSVSIRARHCWRAMHEADDRAQDQSLVSIRARHCWRAMPVDYVTTEGGRGFNPRPPLLAGDAPLMALPMGCTMFQSAPAIAGGRCMRKTP